MEYLEERLLDAIKTLTVLQQEAKKLGIHDQYHWENYMRLSGKIEGVKLALSYLPDEGIA